MIAGTCRLCGANEQLRDSHIIPAFIFRWVRETSANGFLRYGLEPNKRVQDGIKLPWLCAGCEGRFSRWEDRFARELFYPYVEDSRLSLRYGPWLLKFGVSILWRVLLLYREEHDLPGFPEDQLPHLDSAAAAWQDFLLDRRPHPGQYVVHMLPVDGVASSTHVHSMPASTNRYYLRTIDTDVAHGRSTVFVYAKLPRFFFIGFARLDHPDQWKGTKLHASEGLIAPGSTYVLPRPFGDYLNDKIERARQVLEKMSPRQQERVNQTFLANADKLAGSDFVRAMEMDVELFGKEAFKKEG